MGQNSYLKLRAAACAVALLALSQPCSWSAALQSSDSAFSLDLPGEWEDAGTDGPAVVLKAENDHAEVKVRVLPKPLEEAEQKAKLQAIQAKLRKSGVASRKIYSITTASGVRFSFIEFVSEGRRWQSGFFSLGGRTYGLLAADLTAKEFKAIPASLRPLSAAGEAPAEEQAAPASPGPGAGAPEAGSQALPAPPDATGAALGAPPADAASAPGEVQAAPDDLPALPKRQVGGSLALLLIVLVISAAALGYRFLAKREQEAAGEIPAAGGVFPFHIEKRYLAFNTVFDIRDASGQEYQAVSPRWPTLLLGAGLILYFLLKALVQGMLFAGVNLETVPMAVLGPISALLSLSNLLITVGAVLFVFFRKKMKLYDAAGNLLLDVCQKRLSFGSQYFMVRDASGVEGAKLKRVGFVLIRRRWQLLDLQDNVLLDIREDSSGRAIARKFLGHLWGLLRTNYVVSAGEAEIGGIKREWSVWNRYNLHLAPPAGLNPELALAAALFVDIVDPDRWHPWHG